MANDPQALACRLGEKIAVHRRQRGLSQAELANELDLSEGWVSQVERGVRVVDKISTLVRLSEVLGTSLSELATDTPLGVGLVTSPEPGPARIVRLALSAYDALAAPLDDVVSAGAGAELAGTADRAWRMYHAGQYDELGRCIADAIPRLEVAARQVRSDARRGLFKELASLYGVATAMTAKVGSFDTAWVAGDRAIIAAERAGDVMLAVRAEQRLAFAFMGDGRFEQAEHVAEAGARTLRPLLDAANHEALSMWGALKLTSSVIAARRGDADSAYAYLNEAREAADQLGTDDVNFETYFGPTNVAFHEVHIPVELGDAGQALRRAATIEPVGLSPERRARYLMDVARAHLQLGHVDEAVKALEQAERESPELVRSHGLVQAMIRDLLRLNRTHAGLKALSRRSRTTN